MLQSTVELFMFKPAALHIPTLHGPMSDVTTQILIDRWCSASITRCVSNHNLCPGVPASVKYHTTHCLYGLQSPLIINTKACEASSLSVLLNSEHTQSDISMTGHTQFFSLAELHREHNLALYLTFHLFLFVVSLIYLLEVQAPLSWQRWQWVTNLFSQKFVSILTHCCSYFHGRFHRVILPLIWLIWSEWRNLSSRLQRPVDANLLYMWSSIGVRTVSLLMFWYMCDRNYTQLQLSLPEQQVSSIF